MNKLSDKHTHAHAQTRARTPHRVMQKDSFDLVLTHKCAQLSPVASSKTFLT